MITEIYIHISIIYRKSDKDYIVNPEIVKEDLIESYKSKTREEMKSIAKLLDVEIDEDEGAEDIRKKIINNIIKQKLKKNK